MSYRMACAVVGLVGFVVSLLCLAVALAFLIQGLVMEFTV